MRIKPIVEDGAHRYRALGIDPGIAETGYAVIGTFAKGGELCNWGSLKTSAGLSKPCRLQIIYNGIVEIVKSWEPTIVVVEDVYVLDKFPKAAIQLGEVMGVIYIAAQNNNNIEVINIRATEIKKTLAGNGRATKDHVNRAVKRILGMKEEIKPDHASDAAALALIGLSRKGYYTW